MYDIVIIGAGPAGLSAAARAAYWDKERGLNTPSYLLLEGFNHSAKTIYRYQKGKHVMDEPGFLALRSDMPFTSGTREAILGAWDARTDDLKINLRRQVEVTDISGSKGAFELRTSAGDHIQAAHVVLAIGTQGNPRALGCAGDEESDFVRYTLDDPAEFQGETIVVVGAGDAAIENAIALAAYNKVIIVNRRSEFSRAKDGNLNAILKAIHDAGTDLECRYETSVARLELPEQLGKPGAIVLRRPSGEERVDCHRIIARLGTIPPRAFLEAAGIELGGDSIDAIPSIDRQLQSSVPGLYIVGALAGYPLIKQAMNQGQDAIDFILGHPVQPADYPLLQSQFRGLPYVLDAEDVLDLYQQRVPMFRRMNGLAFRELMIESRVIVSRPANACPTQPAGERETHVIPEGSVLFRPGEFGTTFFTIVEGSVELRRGEQAERLEAGQFFGELSLLSGRPREAEVIIQPETILIESPRRILLKLMNSNPDIREGIDRVFKVRELKMAFEPNLTSEQLGDIADQLKVVELEAGAELFQEGDEGEQAFLVRSGTIAMYLAAHEGVVSQHHSGDLLGQLALMGAPMRRATAIAAVRSQVMVLDRQSFLALVGGRPDKIEALQKAASEQLLATSDLVSMDSGAKAIGFFMQQGLGEATDALIINENLCVGCDNCERACAETHAGISRLERKVGPSYNGLHVPQACRHCEVPHCMKDCPPDAIRRDPGGQVYITDACIGCGNCETNCPYDAIKLSYPAPKKPGLLSWLLFGRGPGPGESHHTYGKLSEGSVKKAVKCDACRSLPGGPACVRACPTGAAKRVSPQDFIELVEVR